MRCASRFDNFIINYKKWRTQYIGKYIQFQLKQILKTKLK